MKMTSFWITLVTLVVLIHRQGGVHSENVAKASTSIDIPTSVLLSSILSPWDALTVNNTLCARHSQLYLQELHRSSLWAVKMYESSTMVTPGTYTCTGSVDGGDMDQCLQVNGLSEGENFSGKHCVTTLKFIVRSNSTEPEERKIFLNNILRRQGLLELVDKYDKRAERGDDTYLYMDGVVHWSFCVPSSCTVEDLRHAVAWKLQTAFAHLDVNVEVEADEDYCITRRGKQLDTTGWMTIYCFITYGILLLVGTGYDVAACPTGNRQQGKLEEIARSFSVLKHWKKLTDTHVTKQYMDCLNGIRVLNMVFVASIHEGYVLLFFVPAINHNNRLEEMLGANVSIITSLSSASPDAFFVMSGLLASYNFMKQMAEKGRVGLWELYLNRYLRLTPLLIVFVSIFANLGDLFPRGPYGLHAIKYYSDECKRNWWRSALYINNYVYEEDFKKCLPHTWSLAVDMQLFWLSPVILYSMWKWTKVGLWKTAVVVAISTAVAFYITHSQRLPIVDMPVMSDETRAKYKSLLYCPTHTRTASYCVGIVLGYLLYHGKSRPILLSKRDVILGWILSTLAFFCVVAYVVIYNQPGHKYNSTVEAAYVGLHRIFSSLAIAWMIFACVSGYGGQLNRFLSWRGFSLMSRLAYSFYLVNPLIIVLRLLQIRTPIHHSSQTMIDFFLPDLISTVIAAAIFHVTVEAPFISIAQIITRTEKKKES